MGMYDSFYIMSAADTEKISCPAGHRMVNVELQTKDLECVMASYHVFEGRLFMLKRNADEQTEPPVMHGDSLIITRRQEGRSVDLTQNVVVYTHCHKCLPVVVEQDSAWSRVTGRYPFNEWELKLEKGKLVDVEHVRVESREDVRKTLIKNGVDGVLDDNDRVAKKYLDSLAKGGSDDSLF